MNVINEISHDSGLKSVSGGGGGGGGGGGYFMCQQPHFKPILWS